jgi:hypothetical protein
VFTSPRLRQGNRIAAPSALFYAVGGSTNSSCPGLSRASTSWFPREKSVDGRDKPGHDDEEASCSGSLGPYAVALAASGARRSDSWMLCPQKFPFDFRRAKMTRLRILAAVFARVLHLACPLRRRRAQGRPGARMHPWAFAQKHCAKARRPQVQAESHRPSLHSGLRLTSRSPWGPGFLAPIASHDL